MSKMINLTQGDYGIVLNVQITNEKGEPVYILEGDDVFVHVQFPDNNCEDINPDNMTVTDKSRGMIRLVISEDYTEEEGFYQIFVGITSSSYKITAKKAIQYYVNAQHQIGAH